MLATYFSAVQFVCLAFLCLPSSSAISEGPDHSESPDSQLVIAGRIVDQYGVGYEGRVFVGALESPFLTAKGEPRSSFGELHGRTFTTDPDGSFRIALLENVQVSCIAKRAYYDMSAEIYAQEIVKARPEALAPDEEPTQKLLFKIRRQPSARVEVFFIDPETEELQSGFSIECIAADGGRSNLNSHGRSLTLRVPTPKDRTATFSVELKHPELDEMRVSRIEIPVAVGHAYSVVLGALRSAIEGCVLGDTGPLQDAIVFASGPLGAFGERSFERLSAHEVTGIRTAADGRFRVPGPSEYITAFHPSYGSKTVPTGDSKSIQLQRRGSLVVHRGTLVPNFTGTASWVSLDQNQSASGKLEFDASGSVLFENLEPGGHLLRTSGLQRYLVRIEPGVRTSLDVSPEAPSFLLKLASAGKPFLTDARGLCFGLWTLSRVENFNRPSRAALQADCNSPCRVLREDGVSFEFVATDSDQEIELGSAYLIVRAPQMRNVQVLPVSWLEDLVTVRLATDYVRPVFPGRELRLGPLHRGEYALIDETGAVIARCELRSAEQVLDLGE